MSETSSRLSGNLLAQTEAKTGETVDNKPKLTGTLLGLNKDSPPGILSGTLLERSDAAAEEGKVAPPHILFTDDKGDKLLVTQVMRKFGDTYKKYTVILVNNETRDEIPRVKLEYVSEDGEQRDTITLSVFALQNRLNGLSLDGTEEDDRQIWRLPDKNE